MTRLFEQFSLLPTTLAEIVKGLVVSDVLAWQIIGSILRFPMFLCYNSLSNLQNRIKKFFCQKHMRTGFYFLEHRGFWHQSTANSYQSRTNYSGNKTNPYCIRKWSTYTDDQENVKVFLPSTSKPRHTILQELFWNVSLIRRIISYHHQLWLKEFYKSSTLTKALKKSVARKWNQIYLD